MTPITQLTHCEGKRQFNSVKAINNYLKSAKKRGILISDTLGMYWCKFCQKWHIGHSKKLDYEEDRNRDVRDYQPLHPDNK